MHTGRLFEILYYLQAHGSATARQLAQRFEVSERTIRRDIDALSAAGVPVYTRPGRTGGVALLEGYRLDTALLSEAEQQGSMTFTIPFSRIQLADYLNCDRSALSRELSLMQRDGLLDTYRSSFKLLEPEALRQMIL